MYLNQPVMIPKCKGIGFRKKGESTYVLYVTGRRYDPNRKFNIPTRSEIGIRIEARPELMLPNENYLHYFQEEEEGMETKTQEMLMDYDEERQYRFMLREFFEQLFYEFQIQSRRNPNEILSENKVETLNLVLEPLLALMKDEDYAAFLKILPKPEIHEEKDGSQKMTGMTYSDAALLMTQYKGAVKRYFRKKG